jgi:hypothetical protein
MQVLATKFHSYANFKSLILLVRTAELEPGRDYSQGILSPLRLCTQPINRAAMSLLGQSRPSHLAPVLANVRYTPKATVSRQNAIRRLLRFGRLRGRCGRFVAGRRRRRGGRMWIALIGVLISAIISTVISRRSSYITAVTTQRSKWIDKLRENIAELLATCGAVRMALPDLASAEALGRREKADRLIATITMQLNPENRIDANMIGLLPLFPTRAERIDQNYRELERAFVRHAQFLLKEEWEKVKYEAMGMLSKPQWYKAYRKRQAAYEHFCTLTASLVDRIPASPQ